jgi:hypothetical protein
MNLNVSLRNTVCASAMDASNTAGTRLEVDVSIVLARIILQATPPVLEFWHE